MIGRKASMTRTRTTMAPARTSPKSQCRRTPALSRTQSISRIVSRVNSRQYVRYGVRLPDGRRRAAGAAAAPALEDADPAAAARGRRGRGRAGGRGGDPVGFGGRGGTAGGGGDRDPGPDAVADGAGAALAGDDLRPEERAGGQK